MLSWHYCNVVCFVFKVVQELKQIGKNHRAFGRFFLDREGQDLLKFSSSVFDMMNLFSQAIFRVGLDAQPGNTLSDNKLILILNTLCPR